MSKPNRSGSRNSRPPKADEMDERVKIDTDEAEAALAAFLQVDPDEPPTEGGAPRTPAPTPDPDREPTQRRP